MRPIGMGCMRLSTDPQRDEARALAVLHAAFDAGVTFLDTADAYCLDDSETGHNERLIARALSTWDGDRSRIQIATKGGLTRPRGEWRPDGRARHLVSACAASRRALGVERIHLYQLHAPDPRTPLTTSVRALAGLRRDGLVEAIGLCNVTVGQIEEARSITEIAAVQVELSVWNDANILSGVLDYCIAHGIRLIAHRPLGGAQRRRRTAADVALAWLLELSELVVPIPGPTRVETAQSIPRAYHIRLNADDRARLGERFAAGQPAAEQRSDAEVVLIMGLPSAGKSTLAETFVAEGFVRLNRDETGGSLSSLLPALDRAIEAGATRLVLDNTYVSRKSRAAVIQAARRHGFPVRGIWLATSLEDAQVNAASQAVPRYGPTVQFRYQRELEPPDTSEGFSHLEVRPFVRRCDPGFTNRALIVWCDGVLLGRESVVERGERLRGYQADGWRILGMSWQPKIAEGKATADDVNAEFARMRERLGMDIEVEYCPHGAGPPTCWCRKPLPGMGVAFIQRHHLDPAQCIYVGSGAQDPGFARRLGFQYRDANEFFSG